MTLTRIRFYPVYILFLLLLCSDLWAYKPELQTPQKYTGKEEITGWYMSEKLDGIRGYWDGEKLLTRNGHTIHAPQWFITNFPDFALDGELWAGRKQFNLVQKTVLDQKPSAKWRKISYNILDVPDAEGDFPARLTKAREWFKSHNNAYVRIHPQRICTSKTHLQHFLQEVEKQGGEGVVIKNPHKPYSGGQCSHVLKVKIFDKMDGKVIAINPGKGKFEDMMGSLSIQLQDGTVFKLGSGFSVEQRKDPPDNGSIVTFKYHGWTKYDKPRFASFLEVKHN